MLSQNALLVLDYFGLEERDFERLDKIVDWGALARSIKNPTKLAVCNIIDGKGDVVVNSKKRPVKVHVEVPVAGHEEELKKQSLRFVKWWKSI